MYTWGFVYMHGYQFIEYVNNFTVDLYFMTVKFNNNIIANTMLIFMTFLCFRLQSKAFTVLERLSSTQCLLQSKTLVVGTLLKCT